MSTKGLTPAQRRLVEIGYASVYDFGVTPTDEEILWDKSLREANAERKLQEDALAAAPQPEERGLLDRFGTAITSGYKAASARPGEIMFALGERGERALDPGKLVSEPLMGLVAPGPTAASGAIKALTAFRDVPFGDKSVPEATLDLSSGLTVDRADLAEAVAQRAAARQELAAAVGDSQVLETVGDVAGSAKSYLALPFAAVGSLLGPKGTLAFGAAGAAPMAKDVFFNTYEESMNAFAPAIEAGSLSFEEARETAIERSMALTANEFGLDAAAGMLPFTRYIRGLGGSSVAKQIAVRGTAAVAGGGLSEAATGATGNEIDRLTARFYPNQAVRSAIEPLVEDPASPEYWSNRWRDFRGGALGSAVVSPVVIPGAIKDARAAEAQQRITEAHERALRMGTPNAQRMAEAFSQGILDASDSGPVQAELFGVDESLAPGVGGAIEAETSAALVEEATRNQAPNTTTPLNRLSRERDALREMIETAAENPASLTPIEQSNVAASIDRLNTVESRIANVDAVPQQTELLNAKTDPNIGDIESARRQVAADKLKGEEAVRAEAASQRRAFRTTFLRDNPKATNDEVLRAEGEWLKTRAATPATPATAAAAPAKTGRKAAKPQLPTAPSVQADKDSEVMSEQVLAVLRAARGEKPRTPGPLAAATRVTDMEVTGDKVDEFDPAEIAEPDVRALAESNKSFREHLANTVVNPVMYHGTRALNAISKWVADVGQLGVHMTSNPAVAEYFTKVGGPSPNARVLRLAPKITNPLRLQDRFNWSADSVAPQLEAMGLITPEQAEQAVKDFSEALKLTDSAQRAEAANAVTRALIRSTGHDGVVYFNRVEVPGLNDAQWRARLRDRGLTSADLLELSDFDAKNVFPEMDVSVIALDSNQVKDIDNNVGTFDTRESSLLAAASPPVGDQYRKDLEDVREAFPPMSAERRLIDAHSTATTPAQRIAATFDFVDSTLGNTVTDQFIRTFVMPALRSLSTLISDIVLYPDRTALQYEGGTGRGLFNPASGVIEVARTGMSARVLVHEMLHAATWGAFRNPEFVSKHPDVARAVAGINKVRDLVQAWVDNGGVARLPEGEAKAWLSKGPGRIIGKDGTVSLDELLTYIFTEPAINSALRVVKAPGNLRNAWNVVVESIRKFLRLEPKQADAVDVMLSEGVELLRALAATGKAPTSKQTIEARAFQESSTDQDLIDTTKRAADRAAPLAAASPPGPRPSPPTPDVAARMVSERPLLGRGKDTATGKGVPTKRGKIGGAVSRWLRGARGLAPESVVEVLVNEEGLTASGLIELHGHYLEMRKHVATNASKFFDKKGTHWDKFVTMMDAFETSTDPKEQAAKAQELRDVFGDRTMDLLENMRTQVDQRSMELIQRMYDDAPVDSKGNPVLSQSLISKLNAIAANIGKYNHRSYAVFDARLAEQHRKWLEKTGPGRSVYDAAVKFLVKNDVFIPDDATLDKMSREALERRAAVWVTSQKGLPRTDLRDMLREVRDNPSAYNPDAIAKEAITLADNIVNAKDSPSTRYYLSERADQSILKKREKVPLEIRRLMGENADPGFRVLQTVLKQDMLLNKLKAFREISDRFKGIYVFDNQSAAPEGFRQLQDSDSLGALANKWVHPTVADILDTQSVMATTLATMFDNPQNFVAASAEVMGSGVRAMKGAVLLFSGTAYALNLAGSMLTIVANGHATKLVTNPGLVKEAIATVLENFVALSGGKFTPRVEEMFRRVINDPAMTGEMNRISIEDAISRVYEREAIASARNKFAKAGKVGGWMWDRMFDAYAAMDLWAKVFNYLAEVVEVRAFNATRPEAQRWDEEGIRRVAAERTRQSNFSYERAFPMARALDRLGPTMFATYTSEVFRSLGAGASLVNSDLVLAGEMAGEGNAASAAFLRKMATKRAAGLAAVTIGGGMLGKAAASVVVSLMVMLGLLEAADYDDEEEEMIVQLAADQSPWLKGRQLEVAGIDPKTKTPVVMDMGRGNPYDPAVHAMRLLAQGDLAGAVAATVGGASPLAKWATDVDGQRSRQPRTVREGGLVARGVAAADARGLVSRDVSEGAINLLEVFAPTQLESAFIGEVSVNDAIGYRPLLSDPLKVLGRSGIGRDVYETRADFRRNILEPSTLRSDGAVDAMLAGVVAKELEVYRKGNNAVRLARVLGVPRKEIKEAMEVAGLRKDVSRGLLRENFVPSILSEESLNEAREQAREAAKTPEEKTEINARFRYIKRKLRELRRKARLLEESD